MNIIFSAPKRLYRSLFRGIRLVKNNFVLFGRLMFLVAASAAFGIIFDHLLSYFDEGTRTVAWYVLNIALLVGLFGCAGFAWYLVTDILSNQIGVELQRGKTECTLDNRKAQDEELQEFFKKPKHERMIEYAKIKLLGHFHENQDEKKDE